MKNRFIYLILLLSGSLSGAQIDSSSDKTALEMAKESPVIVSNPGSAPNKPLSWEVEKSKEGKEKSKNIKTFIRENPLLCFYIGYFAFVLIIGGFTINSDRRRRSENPRPFAGGSRPNRWDTPRNHYHNAYTPPLSWYAGDNINPSLISGAERVEETPLMPENDTCCICLCGFPGEVTDVILPHQLEKYRNQATIPFKCKHPMHVACAHRWLSIPGTKGCPLCRTQEQFDPAKTTPTPSL